MDQKRLDEFLQKHCVKAYKNGKIVPNRFDDEDEARWRALISDRENLVIRNGRLQPTQPFGGFRPQGRPPGRPPGSPNVRGRKLSWELPKST